MTRPIPDPGDDTKYLVGSAAEPTLGFQVGPTVLHHVHPPQSCAGRPCVVHSPSEHHMRDWPLNWRGDRRIMERICPHGIGHPDPDDTRYRVSAGRGGSVHGCDGCCVEGDRS